MIGFGDDTWGELQSMMMTTSTDTSSKLAEVANAEQQSKFDEERKAGTELNYSSSNGGGGASGLIGRMLQASFGMGGGGSSGKAKGKGRGKVAVSHDSDDDDDDPTAGMSKIEVYELRRRKYPHGKACFCGCRAHLLGPFLDL